MFLFIVLYTVSLALFLSVYVVSIFAISLSTLSRNVSNLLAIEGSSCADSNPIVVFYPSTASVVCSLIDVSQLRCLRNSSSLFHYCYCVCESLG
jgi:hypothetical protein